MFDFPNMKKICLMLIRNFVHAEFSRITKERMRVITLVPNRKPNTQNYIKNYLEKKNQNVISVVEKTDLSLKCALPEKQVISTEHTTRDLMG